MWPGQVAPLERPGPRVTRQGPDFLPATDGAALVALQPRDVLALGQLLLWLLAKEFLPGPPWMPCVVLSGLLLHCFVSRNRLNVNFFLNKVFEGSKLCGAT